MFVSHAVNSSFFSCGLLVVMLNYKKGSGLNSHNVIRLIDMIIQIYSLILLSSHSVFGFWFWPHLKFSLQTSLSVFFKPWPSSSPAQLTSLLFLSAGCSAFLCILLSIFFHFCHVGSQTEADDDVIHNSPPEGKTTETPPWLEFFF